MDNFEIIFADESHVGLILSFIKELASYEKLSHEVFATEELLKRSLFSHKSNAEVIIAYYNNTPVGFSLFFSNFSTFLGKPGIYIEDLFVKPEYRGKGIGTALFNFLNQLAKTRECGRLEWLVQDWNKKAIEFYQSMDAVQRNDYIVFRKDNCHSSAKKNKAKEEIIAVV